VLLHLRPPPPGATRLDHTTPADPLELIRELASALDALEETGTAPPPLTRTGVWLDEHGDAFIAPAAGPQPGESTAAALARLLEEIGAPKGAEPVLSRARDGAYFSAGQFVGDLDDALAGSRPRRRWLR